MARTSEHGIPTAVARVLWASALAATLAACGDVNAALEQLSEAQRLSADLLVEFTRAADAANRAVMADTDEQSIAFAHEATATKQTIRSDVAALEPILQAGNYAEERRLLQEFMARYAKYDELDQRVLDLAVENTNLKAQRLSFGPAQDAADAFSAALERASSAATPKDVWHAKALAATAVAAVREIQALQAPHIADPDDASMTRTEQRMSTAERRARSALEMLGPLTSPTTLADAAQKLDQFMSVHGQVIALSRRNTNVRSLALSMDEKRKLIAPCEDTLNALRAALAKRSYPTKR